MVPTAMHIAKMLDTAQSDLLVHRKEKQSSILMTHTHTAVIVPFGDLFVPLMDSPGLFNPSFLSLR